MRGEPYKSGNGAEGNRPRMEPATAISGDFRAPPPCAPHPASFLSHCAHTTASNFPVTKLELIEKTGELAQCQ